MKLTEIMKERLDEKKHDVIRLKWQIADLKAAVERAKREREEEEKVEAES